MITSYKILIIKGISNKKTNDYPSMEYYVKTYNILPTKTSFFISSAGKIESVQEFNIKCLIVDDSHVKHVWLHVVVFSKHDILNF